MPFGAQLRIYNGTTYTAYCPLVFPDGQVVNNHLGSNGTSGEYALKWGDYLTLSYNTLKASETIKEWIIINHSRNNWEMIYPVGAIYTSSVATSPAKLFGGTWAEIHGRFLVANGSTSRNSNTVSTFGASPGSFTLTAGQYGGEAKHLLSRDEMPSHNHNTRIVGDKSVHTNIPAVNTTWGYYQGIGDAMDNTGGSTSHNNMPPFYVVYMWRRTS